MNSKIAYHGSARPLSIKNNRAKPSKLLLLVFPQLTGDYKMLLNDKALEFMKRVEAKLALSKGEVLSLTSKVFPGKISQIIRFKTGQNLTHRN